MFFELRYPFSEWFEYNFIHGSYHPRIISDPYSSVQKITFHHLRNDRQFSSGLTLLMLFGLIFFLSMSLVLD